MAKGQISKAGKEKIVFLSLMAAVLLVAYFQFLIKPAVARLKTVMPKVAVLKRDLAAARALITNKPIFKKRQDELTAKMESYEKIFPREREVPKLLENFSNIAGEAGVKIIGIKPIEAGAGPPGGSDEIYQAIPIEIVARSGYHELGKFLQMLETGERFIMIREFKISASPSSLMTHDVRLIAVTYVLARGGE